MKLIYFQSLISVLLLANQHCASMLFPIQIVKAAEKGFSVYATGENVPLEWGECFPILLPPSPTTVTLKCCIYLHFIFLSLHRLTVFLPSSCALDLCSVAQSFILQEQGLGSTGRFQAEEGRGFFVHFPSQCILSVSLILFLEVLCLPRTPFGEGNLGLELGGGGKKSNFAIAGDFHQQCNY